RALPPRYTAADLAAAGLDRPPRDSGDHSIQVSDDQWRAVQMALTNRWSVLTGGPGTGKTTVLKEVVAAAKRLGWEEGEIVLLAPTGIAARRMAAATGHPAGTIHSALGLLPDHAGVGDVVHHLSGLVIVDETSMLDTEVASALLSGLSPDSHILFVGDPDQLPSVGRGAVLRDLLAAQAALPGEAPAHVHLDTVYRTGPGSGIAVNAAHIRRGEMIEDRSDCEIKSEKGSQATHNRIIQLVRESLEGNYDPNKVLVIAPTNEVRNNLNEALQGILNGKAPGNLVQYPLRGGGGGKKLVYQIRVGDPVIVTRNGKELNVSNGERGTVTAIDASGSISVDLAGHDGPVVFRDWARKDLELAYAITGHKSQGNQAPVVIVALPEPSTPSRPSWMAYREWLYTALTRAERQAYLVGDPAAIKECIANPRGEERRTGLAPLLERSLRDHDPTRPAASPVTAHPATHTPSPPPPSQAASPAAVIRPSMATPPREELPMPTEANARTTPPIINIHTDGGCSPNPGAGGYGYVISYGDGRLVEGRGGFPDPGRGEPGRPTNNRMELQAAIAALRQVPSGRDRPVRVYTDAEYLETNMT
ncbi:MAG TPA: AAA family ATPase, partial [Chloroflexota bacterium]|nr:AAA family ATPase [Chloroflexota bacterium]